MAKKITEIRECLVGLEIDEGQIEHFLELLTVLQAKAQNGQREAVTRLHELLTDAVEIHPYSSNAFDSLNDALEIQIQKTRDSLKRLD